VTGHGKSVAVRIYKLHSSPCSTTPMGQTNQHRLWNKAKLSQMSQNTRDASEADCRYLLLPLAQRRQSTTVRKPASSWNVSMPPDHRSRQHELDLRSLFNCAACVSVPGAHSNCQFHNQFLMDGHAWIHMDTSDILNGSENQKGRRYKSPATLIKASESLC
jgi:hypothetical protein